MDGIGPQWGNVRGKFICRIGDYDLHFDDRPKLWGRHYWRGVHDAAALERLSDADKEKLTAVLALL
jgi:hypothetical protein